MGNKAITVRCRLCVTGISGAMHMYSKLCEKVCLRALGL